MLENINKWVKMQASALPCDPLRLVMHFVQDSAVILSVHNNAIGCGGRLLAGNPSQAVMEAARLVMCFVQDLAIVLSIHNNVIGCGG